MAVDSIKAFSDPYYRYYKLKKDFAQVPAGAIFYHDEDDDHLGSISNGCLKLCWDPEGNAYHFIGGAVVLPSILKDDGKWFEEVEIERPQNEDERDEMIKRADILTHIERIKNSGMGKDKALEHLYNIVKYKL